jgi:O-antigen/teichoic acid export membrane protein
MRIRNFSEAKSILFDNLTVKQTIFKNTFWLTISEGISRLTTFVLFIYIARILGATEYGKFAFALAIIGLISILPGFVSSQIITREFARDKTKEKEYSAILSLRIILGLGAIVLAIVASFFVTVDPVIKKAIWILALYNFVNGFDIFYAFLRARQRMEYESLAKVLQAFLIAGFGFFVILNFPSVENLSYGYLFAALTALIPISLFFHFKIHPLSLSWNKAIWQRILSLSWPLALIVIVTTIYNQIDSVMMGYLGQITQTGWYNAALKVVRVTLVPIVLVSQSFFPVLSKFSKESQEKLQKTWNYQMGIMILLAFPLMVGGIVLAPKIIDFIYGQSYSSSILAFQILIIMAGIIFLYEAFQRILVVFNQQKKLFLAVLGGAVINIILNLILIPKYSLYGAAVATVITNLLIFFCLMRFTLKFTPIQPFNLKILTSFIGAVLCSSIMYFVIIQPQIYYLSVILTILIGAASYLMCFLGYKKLTSQFLNY